MTIAMAHWQFTLLQTSLNQEIAQHSHCYKTRTGIRIYVNFSRVKKRKLDYLLTSCQKKQERDLW